MPFHGEGYWYAAEIKMPQSIERVGRRAYDALYENGSLVHWRSFRQDGYWCAEAMLRNGRHERPTGFFVIGNTKQRFTWPTTKFAIVPPVMRSNKATLDRKLSEALLGL